MTRTLEGDDVADTQADAANTKIWAAVKAAWEQEIGGDSTLIRGGLFTPVRLCDTKYPVRDAPDVGWWEADEVASLTRYNQDLLDKAPGAASLIQHHMFPMPPRYTARYLWRYREDANKVAAILCCASLFLHLFSRYRGAPSPEDPAPRELMEEAYWSAAAQWWEPGRGLPWRTNSASALPDIEFAHSRSSDLISLGADLAREHLVLLRTWRPVCITFNGVPQVAN
ncbi:MAG: hypothetical protein EON56_03560 [Alphaproteobacteria bacterium]|nr:MAG: hypothetical protein EON56_03560 [Alphaproteobacteria bacterium]